MFSSIENGIYTAIAASGALLLIRVARPTGHFLGRVIVHQGHERNYREVFIPLERPQYGNVLNKHVKVEPPAPGVVIFRPEQSILYPNSSLFTEKLVDHIKSVTRRGKDMSNVPVRSMLHSVALANLTNFGVLAYPPCMERPCSS